ncbi:MAG: copper chaperone PCu(A)C [Deltaproteobacteria bacterium]|nr:MAG: copper chaperone PCu(A)C [Deltaproteobacteria bacterium]
MLAPASAAPPEGTPPAPKDAPPAKIEVKSPHVRLLPPTAPNTGAFMVIENHGDADVKLVRASNPVSRATELHTHLDEGGVKKMRQVPFILVPAGGQALLQPGGFHVMLIGLERPLREDEVIPLTLGFDDGTELVVEAPVKRPVAPAHAPK